jgi:hypothetical protein
MGARNEPVFNGDWKAVKEQIELGIPVRGFRHGSVRTCTGVASAILSSWKF